MDNSMHTGANSGSFGNVVVPEGQKDRKNKKEEARAKLLPAYELVETLLDKEIAKIKDLDSYFVDSSITADTLHRELLGQKKYLDYLRGLKATLKNTVRDHERKQK